MPANTYKKGPASSYRKKRRSNHTFRNILLIILLITAALLFFLFGVNKWRIEFKLNGDSTVISECGEPYRDEGAEAEVTGSILDFVHHPLFVKVSTERVNIHEPGTYTVTYSSSFLWLSSSATRSVVIVDTTPPVIELSHIEDYYTLPHHAYEEEGFTATDNHDGDISAKVVREEKDGYVYYTVTDEAGNKGTAVREIFYDDRNAPVFSFPSGEEGFLFQGETWTDDVQAQDDADGDVSDRITVSGTVDTGKVGTCTLTYTVSDEWGNVATRERYVTVKRTPISADDAAAQAIITPVTEEAADAASTGSTASGEGSAADGAASASAASAASDAASAASDTASAASDAASAASGTTSAVSGAAADQTAAAAKPAKADPTKIIYLTFDDGPGKYTEELLDILDRHKVLATFFVTAAGKDYRDLIGKEYSAGHTVGVHTATHEYSQIYASTEAYWKDFNEMQDIIQNQTGCRTDIFRFPGGSSNTISANYSSGIMSELVKQSIEKGYIYVDWNITSGDAGDTTSSEVLYQNMMNGIHSYENSFILCHDLKDYTIAAMDRFITDALKEGYTFLPITSESTTCHHALNN